MIIRKTNRLAYWCLQILTHSHLITKYYVALLCLKNVKNERS